MRLRHKSNLASFSFILFFLFLFYPSSPLIAQSGAPVKISGTVTNADGAGIPGVSVRVKGDEKNGVTTDEGVRLKFILETSMFKSQEERNDGEPPVI